jgi:pimeloyl-ACP methyl ester carboxylesterase
LSATDGPATRDIGGIKIELIDRGAGPPLLFLHPGIGIDPAAPVLDRLAAGTRLLAPSHPGFGRSELPRALTNVDDLAYFYLDFLEALDLRDATVVGVSFGAWIAAAVAIKTTERIARLVLADALGIKVGDRETRDVADFFAMTEPEFNQHAYCDPAFARRDYKAMAETDLVAVARNRESLARFGWQPFMHDPKLKGRLRRIRVPTLVLWGASDRIVAPAYGAAYADAIPGAHFERIEGAGHFPHLEQPETFARRVLAFAAGTGAAP